MRRDGETKVIEDGAGSLKTHRLSNRRLVESLSRPVLTPGMPKQEKGVNSMNRSFLWCILMCSALLMTTVAASQSAKPVISLVNETSNAASTTTIVEGEASFANAPANFHAFASTHVGEETHTELLTLRFEESTTLTEIKSSKDFQVVQGGSCIEEGAYSAGQTCVLLVRFTPQGPGPRLGKLTIMHTASVEPMSIGLGGNGYSPVVSFTPAQISTVPGTYPSSKGLLTSAQNLTVDGGDTLYIADSGNNVIRYIDSSGVIRSLTTTATAPRGIAVDNFGEVYFDEPSANTMHEIYDYGPVVQVNGSGTASCPAATPCNLNSEALGQPGTMAIDADNRLFFADNHQGSAMATVQPLPAKLIFLYNPFPFQTNPSSPITADASDNIYSLWYNGGECEIVRSTLYDAENSNVIFTKIVGGHTCGFSGDGGEAGNAEMGSTVGQMAFDIAGNFYFTDTANQRVRRIDATTGIINTIAGTGTAGYTGEYGAGTSAELSSPTGVAVDSQGQVYIISGAASTGTAQIIRKLGTNGFVFFGGQLKGTTSTAHQVTVSNTGNAALTLTNAVITGTNPGDFSIDPATTSCLLTAGSVLDAGQSCKVGFFFKPSAGGTRTANFVLLDNTVTNSNTVELSGIGSLPAPTFTITSPATGTSVTAGTAVKFAVSVTSSSSPVPTGTIVFKVDSTALGSVALSSGTASVNVTETTTGSHTLSASYSGDSNYAAAGPITRTYTVTAAATKVVLASSTNPATNCKPVSFSVTVEGATGVKPTGKVELKKGSAVLATATLSQGETKMSTSALAVGKNVLTASYEGDAKNKPANSTAFTQTIQEACVSATPVTPNQ
jgi:Bacterial Ig-like domain (group 3)